MDTSCICPDPPPCRQRPGRPPVRFPMRWYSSLVHRPDLLRCKPPLYRNRMGMETEFNPTIDNKGGLKVENRNWMMGTECWNKARAVPDPSHPNCTRPLASRGPGMWISQAEGHAKYWEILEESVSWRHCGRGCGWSFQKNGGVDREKHWEVANPNLYPTGMMHFGPDCTSTFYPFTSCIIFSHHWPIGHSMQGLACNWCLSLRHQTRVAQFGTWERMRRGASYLEMASMYAWLFQPFPASWKKYFIGDEPPILFLTKENSLWNHQTLLISCIPVLPVVYNVYISTGWWTFSRLFDGSMSIPVWLYFRLFFRLINPGGLRIRGTLQTVKNL